MRDLSWSVMEHDETERHAVLVSAAFGAGVGAILTIAGVILEHERTERRTPMSTSRGVRGD